MKATLPSTHIESLQQKILRLGLLDITALYKLKRAVDRAIAARLAERRIGGGAR